MRGLKVKEGRKIETEELLKEIGVEMEVKEVWRIARDREVGREMVGLKVEEEGKKREIWEK